MNNLTVEERLAALERQVASLQDAKTNGTPAKDWRSTVGMFTGDADMKQVDEAARKIREADRRRVRRKVTKARVKK